MSLREVWDYMRAKGDPRLRQQGYVSNGVGLLERYRRAEKFWQPHLENNRRALREIAAQLSGSSRGVSPVPNDAPCNPQSPISNPQSSGTLLILGAGRLLDVPWQELFPLFERVVLADADFATEPYVERLVADAPSVPKPIFEINDVTASVVDVAAWATHTINASASASSAAKALAEGFESVCVEQAPWARTYADVRLVVSTNLLSQLGYFPRQHIQAEFRRRFREPFAKYERAAEGLETYFDRVRARHIADVASLKKAWAYVSTDVEIVVYELKGDTKLRSTPVPPNAGVELDASDALKLAWPAEITERNDPLHGQRVKDLWPRGTKTDPPRRWAWHIIPQGSEKKYLDCGRVHIVEAWTKRPH